MVGEDGDNEGGTSRPPGEGPDERSTERRIAAALAVADSDLPHDDPTLAAALQRAAALLRADDLRGGREAVERVLATAPSDPRGQDLLAMLHFRLGDHATAIGIYEGLRAAFPRDPALKLNLALAYLRANRVPAARRELEDLVRDHPHHRRGWGYLGLLYERIGADALALRAFERGQLVDMAARVTNRHDGLTLPLPLAADNAPADLSPIEGDTFPFEELDGGELAPEMAVPDAHATPPVPADAARGDANLTVAPPGGYVPPSEPGAGPTRSFASVPLPTGAPDARWGGAPTAAGPMELRERAFTFPLTAGVVRDASTGLVLVRAAREGRFAARLESVRTFGGALRTGALERQVRGRSTSEPFGGFGAPMVRFEGAGELVLGPRAGAALTLFALGEGGAVLREDVLVGFELRETYENVRHPLEDGDGAAMVALSGACVIVLETVHEIRSLSVGPGAGARVVARRDIIVGWAGELAFRALAPREAPAAQIGLITFEGHGLLLVRAR